MKKTLLFVLPMVMYWNATVAQTGAALKFDGTNDYVSLGAPISANSSYTKEAWINPTDVSGARNIITSASNPFWISNKKLSAGNNDIYSVVADSIDFPTNKWTHVAVTYDAVSKKMILYKNGILVAQNGTAPVYVSGTEIMGSQYGNSSFFVGTVDEVRIWNRALSIVEINKSMTCGVLTKGTGLVSNYHFNQGNAGGLNPGLTTLTDASGNANNGTLFNFALSGSTSNWVAPGVVSGVTTGTDVKSACVSYKWTNGITYTANNNTAQDTLVNKAGCDSIVTLNLTIKKATASTDVKSACVSYKWINGIIYTASTNTAKDTLVNKAGCDSVITLNLTIKNASTSTDVKSACSSYKWINGVTYTESNNTAKDTLVNKAGCDSIITLNLTIKKSLTTDVKSACGSYKWINGVTYTANNNTAKDTLKNIAGCDSIVTLKLTIHNATTGTDVKTACGSYKWINGVTYTVNNNIAKDTIKNVAGCDSIVTLNLTIHHATTGTDVKSACGSYKWSNGVTYTANNNTAKDTLKNVVGCDSIVTLNLTINNVNIATTTIGNNTITSNDGAAAYQWINCSNNQFILGATKQQFVATVSGNYAVILTLGACSDTSKCVNVVITGIKDNTFGNSIKFSPNPTSDYVTISMENNNKLVNYIITSIDGRAISKGATTNDTFKINLSEESKGLYFLRINQGNINGTYKIIKQ
ncbi:MAG: LamG-like jellyroll fold domain-containing protein [Bacteroidia bacterium]